MWRSNNQITARPGKQKSGTRRGVPPIYRRLPGKTSDSPVGPASGSTFQTPPGVSPSNARLSFRTFTWGSPKIPH